MEDYRDPSQSSSSSSLSEFSSSDEQPSIKKTKGAKPTPSVKRKTLKPKRSVKQKDKNRKLTLQDISDICDKLESFDERLISKTRDKVLSDLGRIYVDLSEL